MTEQYKLGQKIRFFRKRARLSQMQLENEINMSPGSISRIENGETNPTKETLQRLKVALNLNIVEYSYLIGEIDTPATKKEIQPAIESIQKYFENRKIMAYLVDDRQRIWFASQGFIKALGITNDFAEENIYGKSTLEIALNPELKIRKSLSDKYIKRVIYYVLVRFHYLMGFMKEDEVYKETIDIIHKYPIAHNQWESAQKTDYLSLNSKEARTVYFKFWGFPIEMVFSVEQLNPFDRFSVYEYTPTNKLIELLGRL